MKVLKYETMETLITLMVEVMHALLRLDGPEIQTIHLYDSNVVIVLWKTLKFEMMVILMTEMDEAAHEL